MTQNRPSSLIVTITSIESAQVLILSPNVGVLIWGSVDITVMTLFDVLYRVCNVCS